MDNTWLLRLYLQYLHSPLILKLVQQLHFLRCVFPQFCVMFITKLETQNRRQFLWCYVFNCYIFQLHVATPSFPCLFLYHVPVSCPG